MLNPWRGWGGVGWLEAGAAMTKGITVAHIRHAERKESRFRHRLRKKISWSICLSGVGMSFPGGCYMFTPIYPGVNDRNRGGQDKESVEFFLSTICMFFHAQYVFCKMNFFFSISLVTEVYSCNVFVNVFSVSFTLGWGVFICPPRVSEFLNFCLITLYCRFLQMNKFKLKGIPG